MYNPKEIPEIEIIFSYSPGERGTHWEPPVPEDIELESLTVNGKKVSTDLEDHLFEFYGEKWVEEIYSHIENERMGL